VYVHHQRPVLASAAQAGTLSRPSSRPGRTYTQPIDTIVVGETGHAKTRDTSTNRVMVLHLSKDRKSAAFISFPFNTLVSIPGRRPATIGSAFAMGGPKLIDRTLERLFGTKMDHIAYTTYDQFLNLSTQVGPVTVNNPKAFDNYGYHFPVGSIGLSGSKAIAFVRGAHGDAAGAEVSRQQLIVEAGVRKELTGNVFDSKSNLSAFIRAGSKNITVDRKLSERTLIKIAVSLNLTSDDIDVIRVPLSANVQVLHGQKVRRVDPVLFKELANDLARDRLSDYVAAHPQH
jgi:LCP family protein required for cell wall assembly